MKREQKQKWRKILFVAPIFIWYIFGTSLSGIIGNVLFVERIGSKYLPYIYVAEAILSVVLATSLAGLLKKRSAALLLKNFSWFGCAFFLLNYWLMIRGYPFAYTLFLVFSGTFYLILGGTVIWEIGSSLCTLFESKIIFMYYSIASSLGGIMAGLVSGYLGERLGMEQLVLILCASLAFAGINLIFIDRAFREKLAPETDSTEQFSQWVLLKKGFEDFRKTRIAKMLFLTLLLFNIVWWISDYEFQKIVGDSLSEEEYSRMSGMLSIVNSVAITVMLLFIQNMLFKKAGVMNVLFLSPVFLFVAFLSLFFFPLPPFALAVNILAPLIGYSIFNTSTRFVQTSIPYSLRATVVTFINGNSDAIAMLLAGAGLVVLTSFVSNEWVIITTCLILIANIIVVQKMKKEYVAQVLRNLASTNVKDMHGAIENLGEPVYHHVGVQELMKLITWRNLNSETVRKIVFTLGKIDNIKVIPALLEIFPRYDATVKYSIIEAIHAFSRLNERLKDFPFTRLNIIEAYEKIFLEDEDPALKIFILEHLRDFDPDKAIVFLRSAIANEHPEIRQKAIAAMRYFHDRGIIIYIKPYLDDANLLTRAAAVTTLWQFSEMKLLLMKRIIELMMGTSKEHIEASLTMIGNLKFAWEIAYVKKQQEHADSPLTQLASLTLLKLEDSGGVESAVAALIEKTPASEFFAKGLKELSKQMVQKILREVKNHGEISVTNCVSIMKSTYLNFTEEIDELTTAETEVVTASRTLVSERQAAT